MDIVQALVPLVLALLQQIVPQLGTANAEIITKIISGLEVLIPLLVKEYQDLVPMVQNVISTLKNNNVVTQDQWNTLDVLEQKLDSDFEVAATQALADDN